jgi:hypothetical protein
LSVHAVLGIMTVCPEFSRAEFELDAQPLPIARSHLSLRRAIRKSLLDHLHHLAKLVTDHAKEKNHAQFVDRGALETADADEVRNPP